MDLIYQYLGQIFTWILSAIGGGALVLLFIKTWGKSWIENKFSKDLEAFKAQKLHEFDLLLTRKVKWHEKEYEVLSTCWQKLMTSYNALKVSLNAFREVTDLSQYNSEEFEKFLNRSGLDESAKDYLRSEKDKNAAYIRVLDFKDVQEAHKLFHEFHTYFENNRIFLSPDVKEKFNAIDDHIWSAWVSRKMALDDKKLSFRIEARNKEKEEIAPLINDIEELLQKKLFPEEPQKEQK